MMTSAAAIAAMPSSKTVDAYVDQFERLLNEVAGDDRTSYGRAHLSHIRDWQGLHHAGACGGPLRLRARQSA